ncbi:MAG: chemotaxis response regulator protein-glutamate methylesterase [Sandaracinobacter sp.]
MGHLPVPVRTLVIDDSASMRMMLRRLLTADPGIEVVGTASCPDTAGGAIAELRPDVLTLDVDMPGTDGLTFLARLMDARPMPVVMCSSLTAKGAEVSIEALRLGAFDCVPKPSGDPDAVAEAATILRETVKAAGRSHIRRAQPQTVAPATPQARHTSSGLAGSNAVIAIGASTGGVEALFEILGSLPADCPPVLIVQHMPAAFTAGFASRLDRNSPLEVLHAVDRTPLKRGTAYIAPGGTLHMEVVPGNPPHIRLVEGPPSGGHRPSVDRLFHSVAALGRPMVGVILTGMGRDGAEGLAAMRRAGARTIGQDQASSVVYGMPRAAAEAGAIMEQTDLSRMPEAIVAACRALASRSR